MSGPSNLNVVIGAKSQPSLGRELDALMGRLLGLNGFLAGMRTQIAALAGGAGIAALVRQGVEFNSKIQIATRGLAATFTLYDKSSRNFQEATQRAGRAVELLKKIGGESFEDLLESYSANAGTLFRSGITDLERQLELLKLIGSAIKSYGLSGPQFIQEMRGIFSGEFGPAQTVASALFPTDDVRQKWRAALASGRGVYETLRPRLEPYRQAGELGSRDYDIVVGKFETAVRSLAGEFTRGPMQQFTSALQSFTDLLKSPGFKTWVERILGEVKSLVIAGGLMAAAGAVRNGARAMGIGSGADLAAMGTLVAQGGLSAVWQLLPGKLTGFVAALGRFTLTAGMFWSGVKVFQAAAELWGLRGDLKNQDATREQYASGADALAPHLNRAWDDALARGEQTPEYVAGMRSRLAELRRTNPEAYANVVRELWQDYRGRYIGAEQPATAAATASPFVPRKTQLPDLDVRNLSGNWTARGGFLSLGEGRLLTQQMNWTRDSAMTLRGIMGFLERNLADFQPQEL